MSLNLNVYMQTHSFFFQNWLAFETLEQPLFAEHGSSLFSRTFQNPVPGDNYAQCQVNLLTFYQAIPFVGSEVER